MPDQRPCDNGRNSIDNNSELNSYIYPNHLKDAVSELSQEISARRSTKIIVIPLSSVAMLNWFSSLAPFGQAITGSSLALLIFPMEQPFYSINALVLTLSRLAESCISKWLGYTFTNIDCIKAFSSLLLVYIR